jgi:hypothetical protein
MDDPLVGERYGLEHNVYSPVSLAKALNGTVKKCSIYKAIKDGQLAAKRPGKKNIVIFRPDIVSWLDNLPSAAALAKPGRGERENRRKSASEIAHEYQRRQRMAAFRREGRK